MKLILHIGMGKTGTTAIQHALSVNDKALRSQNVLYLGMWFDIIDERFAGLLKQRDFYSLPENQLRQHAEDFHDKLEAFAKAEGAKAFVMSNEGFSGNQKALIPFLDVLSDKGVQVMMIAYVRNPGRWLPSAYAQWALRDKVDPGPIVPYSKKARELVRWYQALITWKEAAGDALVVRHFDAVGDIVEDFSKVTGVQIPPARERVYERLEDSELLLRAVFNNRFDQRVLPSVFERSVLHRTSPAPDIEAILNDCFDYSETEAIISEQMDLFEAYKTRFDIDLLGDRSDTPQTPDLDTMRQRIFEYLLEFSLSQATRITRLEQRLNKISKSF